MVLWKIRINFMFLCCSIHLQNSSVFLVFSIRKFKSSKNWLKDVLLKPMQGLCDVACCQKLKNKWKKKWKCERSFCGLGENWVETVFGTQRWIPLRAETISTKNTVWGVYIDWLTLGCDERDRFRCEAGTRTGRGDEWDVCTPTSTEPLTAIYVVLDSINRTGKHDIIYPL